MPVLTAARRSELRAQAHGLSPVVMIGDKGLTESVVAEVDRALLAHELVKVKAATDDREARAAWMAQLCERLEAHSVQVIGKILVLWRENPERAKAKAEAARPAPRKAAPKKPAGASSRQKKHRSAEELIRIERQRSRTPSSPPESGPRRRRPRTSR